MNKMGKKNSIAVGIAKYSVSTWANLIVGFVSVILTTRLLPPDVYGLVSLFYSFTAVLMYVLSLGMDGALIRFYNEPPLNNSVHQLLYKIIVLSFVMCLSVGILCVTFWGNEISNSIFGFYSRSLLGLCFLYTFSQIVLRYLNISFRMSFRVKQYTVQNILMNCLSRVLVICAAFFTNGFEYIVLILSIGTFTVLLTYIFVQSSEILPLTADRKYDFKIDFSNYGPYFRFALFSAPTYIVTYLNSYLNCQIISSLLNTYSLGIYASTHTFGQILSAIKGGFATYWSAYVYKNYQSEQTKICIMHNYVLVLAIVIASGLVVFRDVIYLVIGQQFHASKQFFSLVLVSPMMYFVLETTDKGIALAKKNHITLITHSFSVLVNVALSLFLIPYLSILGAAWANAMAGVFLYILNTVMGQKYYKSIPNVGKSILGILFVIVVLLVPSVTMDMGVICVAVLIVDVFAYLLFKKEVLDMVRRVLNFLNRNKA